MFGDVCINNVHGFGRVAQAHGGRRCEKLGIASKLKADDKDLVGKPLMKRIMQAWLPAHEVRARVQSGSGGCVALLLGSGLRRVVCRGASCAGDAQHNALREC